MSSQNVLMVAGVLKYTQALLVDHDNGHVESRNDFVSGLLHAAEMAEELCRLHPS